MKSYYEELKEAGKNTINFCQQEIQRVLCEARGKNPDNPVTRDIVEALERKVNQAIEAAQYNLISVATRYENDKERHDAQYLLYKEACKEKKEN